MTTNVILPALGMAQETGKIIRWLKSEGEMVRQGEPLVEIETDKAAVELEAPATGIVANISAAPDDEIPVGQTIAHIVEPGSISQPVENGAQKAVPPVSIEDGTRLSIPVSPLAARIAAEHHLNIDEIQPAGKRIQKADVLSYLQQLGQKREQEASAAQSESVRPGSAVGLLAASPKARRLAREQGKDLTFIRGSGPDGAILAADVLAASLPVAAQSVAETVVETPHSEARELATSRTWRLMAERTTQSWTSVPHFFLMRDVNASRLMIWREQVQKRTTEKITYTDLLVKVVAALLQKHPRLNASWSEGRILLNEVVNIGIAAASEEGLIVPVIQRANTLPMSQIAYQRKELVERTHTGKVRLEDVSGGTFTISNLGMYGVDSFKAIINPPQAAILAVGRIVDRVVPVGGQPAVQPMMSLCLSCDHRVVDGARAAQFLTELADVLEEPLALLE
ncbi:dihydrolipoamide acetyltransferase component of pyruvate dehydrogenase complex [Reticulibacter mediterranei]|uniref:Dihydrolipoamide acetyltransferase component of pyruvate dehydrogenase complex n=1 Tax=Reticulibacter mediterranei TaxID=2778369 RepID=A0A8J3IM67_9CHLR|nr:dihydrolipoamide acetyltransferase family protein [Reticulibacter mediterranei]GHO97106.1 dihydrolipoamide acetyltransferase component of pyruvate dehydrogenase complex [Reticulibacter mediterranei]